MPQTLEHVAAYTGLRVFLVGFVCFSLVLGGFFTKEVVEF